MPKKWTKILWIWVNTIIDMLPNMSLWKLDVLSTSYVGAEDFSFRRFVIWISFTSTSRKKFYLNLRNRFLNLISLIWSKNTSRTNMDLFDLKKFIWFKDTLFGSNTFYFIQINQIKSFKQITFFDSSTSFFWVLRNNLFHFIIFERKQFFH